MKNIIDKLFNETSKKKLLLLSGKLIEKIPNATNAKQYYQYYLKRKKTGETIKNLSYQKQQKTPALLT